MSSLALIDSMLLSLGHTTDIDTNDESVISSTIQHTSGGDNECATKEHDVQLTLRGIPEYENYPHNSTSNRFLFMADITAPLFKKTMDRASIDLVCVIDDSGSMQGDRLQLVLQTVEFIIKNLEAKDRFGLITFSNESTVVLNLTTMDDEGKALASTQSSTITAGGCTALSNGLMDGITMLRNRDKSDAKKNKIASVMLFTDGKANRGITNKMRILKEMDKQMMEMDDENTTLGDDDAKQVEGKENDDVFSCSINTFGFGKDHNTSLLEGIAERGNGMYSFIETEDLIAETFAEALGGLTSVCGQNLYVTVKALNGVAITKCLSQRYKKKVIKKDEVMQVIIPDIQSEEKRSLLFELSVPSVEKVANDWRMIDFNVEYNNTISNRKEVLNTVCSVNRVKGELKDVGPRNMELDVQNNRIIAAEAMEKANSLAESNQLDEARKVIKNAQQLIQTSVSKENTYCAALVHDLEQSLSKLVSHYAYKTSGRQYMSMNCSSHWNQRSTQSYNLRTNMSQAAYRTTSRSAWVNNSRTIPRTIPRTVPVVPNPPISKNDNDKDKKDKGKDTDKKQDK
eukprot:41901_1